MFLKLSASIVAFLRRLLSDDQVDAVLLTFFGLSFREFSLPLILPLLEVVLFYSSLL